MSADRLTPFSDILSGIVPQNDRFVVSVAENWRQGRTLYGGLSAALCVECAVRSVSQLPPLRSAQFCFIAPGPGQACIVPAVLRRGKSAVFIGVDLYGENGLAVRATLCFGASRSSKLEYTNLPAPEIAGPESSQLIFGFDSAYAFTRQFDFRLARGEQPFSGGQIPARTEWVRHKDRTAPDSATSLLALADVPPAAIVLFSDHSPVSTITWMVDILTDFPVEGDGWRLVEVRADTIIAGYSSQSLNIWNTGGKPLLASRQYVAVFA